MMVNEQWITGKVVHGLHYGTQLGFPTANLLLDKNNPLQKGVYAVRVKIKNLFFYGMLYVGTRPTINLTELSYEINIFDFNQSIYDDEISFKIEKKIREECTFSSVSELIIQLKKDKNEIIRFFNL